MEMTEKSIVIEAIGPQGTRYQELAKGIQASFRGRGIVVQAPRTKSESSWTSVIISVSSGIETDLLNNLIDLLTTLADGEQEKHDLSIHLEGDEVFYDLQKEKQKFLTRYPQMKPKSGAVTKARSTDDLEESAIE